MRPLLTTGEVAAMLGVSRQHVVDLCDRGALPSVRVGTHRRVPRAAVERLARTPLTREQERSWWLHLAVAAALLSDPEDVTARARDNVQRGLAEHRVDGRTASALERWAQALEGGLDEVLELLTRTDPEACELRHSSPFAGVLSDDVRLRLLRTLIEHRHVQHDPGVGAQGDQVAEPVDAAGAR